MAPVLKSKWSKLTDDELAAIGGQRELLVGALERVYGIQKKHAELQVDRWVSDSKPAKSVDTGSGAES